MTATPAPVQALLDAVNRGDTDGFLGCFTKDGVVDDWGRQFRGAQAILSWSDGELIGVRASLKVTSVDEHDGASPSRRSSAATGSTGRATSLSISTATASPA